MPELPEVETIRRQLFKKIIGKKLRGREITGVRRRAKVLMLDFDDGTSLIFHLMLTGQLIFNGKPSQHTRKVFNFDDGSQLIFNDARKFGWWKKVKNTREIEKSFGPEAPDISLAMLKNILGKRPNVKIKPLLMDQKFIAGIGNIYSDEILFASRINPLRRVKTLSGKDIRKIFQNIKKILKAAIKQGGSSVKDYLDTYGKRGNYTKYHRVYQKQKCPVCGTGIKKVKVGGRSAHFCPVCQPIR